jgi:cell division protein FtsQ
VSRVAAPADRRFRRAHVKPSQRRWNWRPLARRAAVSGLSVAALAFALYRGRTALSHIGTVDRIVVRGNERLSKGEVLAVLNGLHGESLFGTDLEVWHERLMRSPWVRDAALRRSLPSTVEVVISERQPVGIGRVNGDTYLVDERGVVIDQYGPQYADLDLPIIDGLMAVSGDEGSTADVARAELAARLIAAVRSRPEMARKLSQIDVTDVHNASVILSGDPAVIYVGEDQFLQRLQSYVELAPTLRARVPDIDYVDLRFDERIYVRPAGKPGRTRDVAQASAGTKSNKRQ